MPDKDDDLMGGLMKGVKSDVQGGADDFMEGTEKLLGKDTGEALMSGDIGGALKSIVQTPIDVGKKTMDMTEHAAGRDSLEGATGMELPSLTKK
ncbi:MAG: hypothetical protein AB7F64_02085 [Gammaproteobacteria bacterium]